MVAITELVAGLSRHSVRRYGTVTVRQERSLGDVVKIVAAWQSAAQYPRSASGIPRPI